MYMTYIIKPLHEIFENIFIFIFYKALLQNSYVLILNKKNIF